MPHKKQAEKDVNSEADAFKVMLMYQNLYLKLAITIPTKWKVALPVISELMEHNSSLIYV